MQWNPDLLKLAWTLMGVVGFAFSAAIVRIFLQYHQAALDIERTNDDARNLSRDFLIGEGVRLFVQSLIVAAGVLALFIPPPKVREVTLPGILLALIFMLICAAAMFGSVHAYVSWRHRERAILLRHNLPIDAPPRFVIVMVRVVEAVERCVIGSIQRRRK